MPVPTWSLVTAALAVGTLAGVLIRQPPERPEAPRFAPATCAEVVADSSEVANVPKAAPAPPPVVPAEVRKPSPPPGHTVPRAPLTCRRPHRIGTDVRLSLPPLGHGRVVVSPWDVRLVAVYDDEKVVLSRDEGRTWAPVLNSPPSEHYLSVSVQDLRFDCAARLHVLRGHGTLGVHDPVAGLDTWATIPLFEDTLEAHLVVDRLEVKVLGPDPGRPDQLVLAQRDDALGWSSAVVFVDNVRAQWDQTSIDGLRRQGAGRFVAWVTPWVDGVFIPNGHFLVRFNARTGTWRSTWKGEEPATWPGSEAPPVIDAAGRTVELDPGPPLQLLRTGGSR